MAADGYSRVTGNIGVGMVTSGPGATNTLTGICSSFFDSIPTLLISGQVSSNRVRQTTKLRQYGFQETDVVSIFQSVTKYAKHKKAAVKFLEWLSGQTAQRLFADSNMEYPANAGVPANRVVKAWGKFKQDNMNLAQAGKLQAQAVKLMDRAGYK